MTTAGGGDVGASVRPRSTPLVEDPGLETRLRMSGGPGRTGGPLSPPHLPQRTLLLVGEGGPVAGYAGEPIGIRPARIAELKSLFVKGGSGSAPVAGFLAWAADRTPGRVSVMACASDGTALRFHGRVCSAAKGVTLEMPL